MEFDKEAIEDLSYNEAFQMLEGLVARLESSELELEERLEDYEKSVALVASLQNRLANAQQKVDILMGQLEERADDESTDTTLS